MPHIVVISASVRIARNSHRVALFFKTFIEEQNLATVEILDLQAYNFPLFEERLRYQSSPTGVVLDFAKRVKDADGIILVTPEYNGGYPASLKNAIDLLTDEWHHKPVAISTVSSGNFGGSQAITSLQFSLWKMHAWTVPTVFPVVRVQESYDAKGIPSEKQETVQKATIFIRELLWCIEAKKRMGEGL